jgi:hypothetical protein
MEQCRILQMPDVEDVAVQQWKCCNMVQSFTQFPKKPVRQYAHETGDSRTTVYLVLWHQNLKLCAPGLHHAMNEDDPDHLMEFYEWFLHSDERQCFPGNF